MAVALSEADVAGMLEVLHEAAVVDGPDAFTERVVDALVQLLPVDGGACCNAFAALDPRTPDDELTRRLNFTSLKRGAIADRYAQILQLLAPHFVTLYQRAAARRARGAHSLVSPRELEILSLIRAGKTNKEIACELWLSPHTVRSHLENAFEKLEVTNRTAAVARAFDAPAEAGRHN